MSIDILLLTNTAGPVWQRTLGAYQVAHHCRQNGYNVQVIDFVDLMTNQELENLIQKFVDTNTLALGISTTFFYNLVTKQRYISESRSVAKILSDDVRMIIEKIKKTYPNLTIFAGGANSYIAQNDNLFDVVFHGYSEQSVVEYFNAKKIKQRRLYPVQGNTEIINGASAHFDITTLQHQWHKQDCVLPNETLPIEISRGCIFKCKFCAYPLNGKKKFDYLRDPEFIKEELVRNYELYGTTNYYFTDDTFNDSSFKLERLHKTITSLPFKIKFVTYLRLDLIYRYKEQIDLLYEMGLGSAFFGIETLNNRTGKIIGKGLSPIKVKDFLIKLHDVHWKQEVPITCSFIIGLPYDTETTVRQAHEWCQQSPINDIWFPLFIRSDTHYKSEFDINYTQYGYSIDSEGQWRNNNFTYSTALELAEEFNSQGLYGTNTSSTWFLFALLSYGYKIEDLKNIAAKDLPWKQYARDKKRLFKLYRDMIFNL
jgi:radical SAM superfamily enzyme YgiQ (UPF0313 family)